MEFEIEVIFEDKKEHLFWTNKLESTSVQLTNDLKNKMARHIPMVVTEPSGIDFDDDIDDMQNVYDAILNIYPKIKIIKEPPFENLIY
ncbi:hypothetical protein REH36_04295 [Pediococcus pentosaceus]|uniref:hypothetical protein n=1 Tax=Pediococcus pentosaceus TaxID=1255 RepID=UPI002B4BE99B|nr:hypothetical protein [Pediococcus pentosaceus]MEB3377149.1 hypothetical protein [Pediococcus pentosaceus]